MNIIIQCNKEQYIKLVKLSCPFNSTGGMSRGYRCSSAVEPPPRSPHFLRVVLVATLCHSGETSMCLHSPYVEYLLQSLFLDYKG